jgi:CxxC motif-containing protein (DUF1111 family)
MRAPRKNVMRLAALAASGLLCFLSTEFGWADEPSQESPAGEPETHANTSPGASLGETLFMRKWEVDDPRGRGGDGLGPVFNERSCVACHGLGGPGGGGKNDKNVDLLSAGLVRRGGFGAPGVSPRPDASSDSSDRSPLAKIHPGLVSAGSIVLHQYGTAPGFDAWRAQFHSSHNRHSSMPRTGATVLTSLNTQFSLVLSHRNSTALFGAGQIDAIPDEVIEREAERQKWQEVSSEGRVARQKNGRIGRFGWKAQVPSLRDFVLNACAAELGLESPTHHQSVDPFGNGSRPGAVDLSDEDCDALIDYVRNLPAPIEQHSKRHAAGFEQFVTIGCAECHRPNLGEVEGIFSDLLLHDMGGNLSDSGQSYGGEIPVETSPGGTKPSEWRTPPLWGVADSAPYLHDGRAQTLVDAIEAHAGQADESRRKFANLRTEPRKQLIAFLHSLKAPKGKTVKVASR